MQTTEIRNRLKVELEKKIELGNGEVLVYGAGNTSLLYESCFEKEGILFSYFVDGDKDKVGKTFLGKSVISVDDLVEKHADATVLIASANIDTYRVIKKNLDQYGIRNFHVDEYVFSKNKDAVLEVFDLLQDDTSKETYANMILVRMNRENLNLDLVCEKQYFILNPFRNPDSNEVFVDCGAYVGDTVEQYLFQKSGVFRKIVAFEPEAQNFKALSYRVQRLRKEWAISQKNLELVYAGVGEKSETGWMETSEQEKPTLGAKIHLSSNGEQVKIYSLDDYFMNQRITFLKADIESYEKKMILGAKKIIQRDHPKMAICIYHNASDMYEIPLLLNEMNLGYTFSVRQHQGSMLETVLYAY